MKKKFYLVEDTILELYNESNKVWTEIVDIRFKMSSMNVLSKAKLVTSIAYSDGKEIHVFRGEIIGSYNSSRPAKGFGFDNFFIPEGQNLSLYELDLNNLKDKFSPRAEALLNFKKNKNIFVKNINEIDTWTGEYQ